MIHSSLYIRAVHQTMNISTILPKWAWNRPKWDPLDLIRKYVPCMSNDAALKNHRKKFWENLNEIGDEFEIWIIGLVYNSHCLGKVQEGYEWLNFEEYVYWNRVKWFIWVKNEDVSGRAPISPLPEIITAKRLGLDMPIECQKIGFPNTH